MIKKALSIMICTLILLMGVPFKSLAADTISQSNVKGVNYSVISIVPMNQQYQLNGNTYVQCVFTHRFEVVLDKEYLGYVTGQLNGSYQAYNSTGTFTSYSAQSGSRSYYVAGNTFEYYVQTYAYMLINQINNYSTTYSATFTYSGSNVIDISLLESLDDIQTAIEMLDFHTEQITQYLYDSTNGTILEQVVTTNQLLVDAGQMFYNVMLATDNINDYVIKIYEFLENFKYYNFPLESFNFVYPSYDIADIYNTFEMFNYIYPIFKTRDTHQIISNYINGDPAGEDSYIDIVLWAFQNSSTFNFTWTSGYTREYYKQLAYFRSQELGYCYLYHFKLKRGANASNYFSMYSSNVDYFVPIYLNVKSKQYYSTSFGETFDLIDSAYQEDLNNNTDQMQSEFNDLFTIEDDYGDQLNNQLNNIDFTNPLQNNTSMLSSGNFVIQVFNGLIANNPLSILIIIVCIFFVARRLFG